MSKHTPGPWIMAASPSSVVGWPIVSSTGRVIASLNYVNHSINDPTVAGDKAFNIESKANGRLIAAAPDLLKVLKDLMAMRQKCYIPNTGSWWDEKAIAAIAKAEGRE